MVAFKACITAKAEAGIIDTEAAQRIASELDATAESITTNSRVPRREAERRAAVEIQERIERSANQRARSFAKQALVEADVRELATLAKDAGIPVEKAMLHRLSFDPRDRGIGPSLDLRIETVRGEAHASMNEFLSNFRAKLAGQEKADLPDVIREMYGQNTGNASARAMAEGLKEAMDRLRARYNTAGGDIRERQDFGLWHKHDAAAVSQVGKDQWKTFIRERVDPDRMFDDAGEPLTLRRLDQALDEMYDDIASGGLISPERNIYGSSVTGRQNARFLAFRSADDWMEYDKLFGSRDLYDHVITNIESLAKDVGTLEIMGPFPEATLRTMGELSGGSSTAVRSVRAVYESVTGKLSIPSNASVAAISQGVRNVQVAAKLGGAFLSSLSDTVTTAAAARWNGMPVTKVLARHMKLFVGAGAADKRQAVRLGFTAQGWTSRAIAAQRVVGESFVVTDPLTRTQQVAEGFNRGTQIAADKVLRAGLLSPWTDAGKWAFKTEMLGFITENARKPWANLPDPLKRGLGGSGIGPSDWDIIRKTQQYVDPETGASFLRPEDVSRGDTNTVPFGQRKKRFEAGQNLMSFINKESKFAIFEASPRVTGQLLFGSQAGTVMGEIARNALLFKSFPITIMTMSFNRMLSNAPLASRAEFLATLVMGTTMMGALGEQMSQISKGKDPRRMSDPKFWLAAFLRGGSFGLIGDFLFQDQNRYGGGLGSTLLGPVFSEAEGLVELTVGNVQELVTGEDTNAFGELTRFTQRNLPGQSLFYLRLGLERMVFDQVQLMADPKARQKFRKIERRARRDFNQRFFFRPGHTSPDRLPDLSAALK